MTHTSEGDWGETQLDPAEQAEADINLDEPSSTANEPWSPPDRQPRGAEFIEGDETISQRLRQEEPDVQAGYVDPDEVEMLGGDDPDAVPTDTDVVGGPITDAVLEAIEADTEADADDVGTEFEPGGDHGPEASAMHIER